ncbi:MAG: hypothetical protein DI534_03365 [Leifsonia xyli]|nr:MAG: hypothetical protein DI534_03365 [Leifsonia xyli]
MRFVIAIVLFAVAAVSIGLGVAQRTILRGPDQLVSKIDVTGGAPFTVIDGATLGANPGAQLLEVSGSGSSPVFMAYGRSDDVRAWLDGARAVQIDYDAATATLTSKPLAAQDGAGGTPSGAPSETPSEVPSSTPATSGDATAADETPAAAGVSPVGSDLWIQEFTGEGSLVRKVNVPSDVSVLIASDGTAAAPAAVSITWPLDNSTPWSGPLIVAGIGALLLGLIALIWALIHARRRHGPRRKTPKMPKPPKPAQLKPAPRRAAITTGAEPRGRRRVFIALPVLLVGALVLSACTPDGDTEPSPSNTVAPAADIDPPVVTQQQFTRIVSQTADVVAKADSAGDAALAAERLDGPALELRTANYTARAADSSIAALPAFPSGTVSLILPQQQHDWPRAVFAAIADAEGNDYGLMFVQNSPRDQYKVQYLVRLTQSIPEVAPVDLGASRYPTDSKLLAFPPSKLAGEYGDLLIKGDNSAFAADFDAADDVLQEKFGAAYKAQRAADLPNAVVSYTSTSDEDAPIALAANDTGAIVVVELRETETVKPAETGAAISPKGAVKALSQKQTTTKGIDAVYGMQILFYVPPATASDPKVRLLGFTQGLVAASEVP